ncbi:hypothetical protein ACFYSW_30050 [Rhodococcus aetherivorans]|uniref:hypothetical protein n=1 Tax=Rhodococcus aetherivorans TaxID=191292 RepID=UPI0036CF562A
MEDSLLLLVGAAGILTGLYRTHKSLRGGQSLLVGIGFMTLGFAFVSISEPVQHAASDLYPSIGRLFSNCLSVLAAYLALRATFTKTDPTSLTQRTGRWDAPTVGLVATLLIMSACFFATAELPREIGLFGSLYRHNPTLTVYALTYSFYLLCTLTTVAFVCLRVAFNTNSSRLRGSMSAMGVAASLGVVYAAMKAYRVTLFATGLDVAREARCEITTRGVDECSTSVLLPLITGLIAALSIIVMVIPIRVANHRIRIERLQLVRDAARAQALSRKGISRPEVRTHNHQEQRIMLLVDIYDNLLELGLVGLTPTEVAKKLHSDEDLGRGVFPPSPENPHSSGSSREAERWIVDVARQYARTSSNFSAD